MNIKLVLIDGEVKRLDGEYSVQTNHIEIKYGTKSSKIVCAIIPLHGVAYMEAVSA